jgi:CubicO group peptidase (beta-lactamase class C family)
VISGAAGRCTRAVLAALALALALAAAPARGQEAGAVHAPARSEAVAARVALERLRLGLPALAAGRLDAGRIEVAAAGYADVEHDAPATTATRFRLASVSKPLTAVLTLRLVEEGRLDLDADVRRLGGPLAALRQPITVRELLAHTAGVRHYRGDEMASTRTYPDLQAALPIFLADPLVAAPGLRHVYTTYGCTLLGVAIERAAGEPYFDALRHRVLEPAGMAQTVVDAQAALIPGRARGYRRTADGALANAHLADTSYKVPGGGLLSTTGDLLLFASALLEGRLLREETLQAMWSPARTRDGAEFPYGLGWSLARDGDQLVVYHTGAQQGASTLLWIEPGPRRAAVALTNLEGQRNGLMDLARGLLAPAPAPVP